MGSTTINVFITGTAGSNVPFPGWDEVEAERRQEEPKIWLTVTSENGNVIRKLNGPTTKGFHRVAWDLRYAATTVIDVHKEKNNQWGLMAMAVPGTYTVSLSKEIDGVITPLSVPVSFKVKQLQKGALDGAIPEETVAFWREIQKMQGVVSATSLELNNAFKKVKAMQLALARAEKQPGETDVELHQLKQELLVLMEKMNGNRSKDEIGEKNNPTIKSRLSAAARGVENSTYGPTSTNIRSLELAAKELTELKASLDIIIEKKIPELEKELQTTGAPKVK